MSKSQWAYRTVRAMILSGELEPGTSLDQQALASRIGLSTTPLREALRRLEAENYVIARDHREMTVAPMSLEYVEQIYVVRLVLDPLAARLGCERMSDSDLRKVEGLVPQAGKSKLEYLEQNREFHRAIYAASGNVPMTRVLDGLYDQSDRYRARVLDDSEMANRALEEHAQMCDLVLKRDSDGLAALMTTHLLGSLEHYRRVGTRLL
ncbi:GntR family transcriptional regulator [Nocardioides sp.]|uniref:GntR family transcriptional regulator n=1 Tax=Nocardioides sp. TaxID=35761 RepID=UPI003D0C87C8